MILSLALTGIVLVILAMAVDFHLRALESSRGHVEEAQIARAVMQLIANDLRNSVHPNPVKCDNVSASLLSGSSTGGASGGSSTSSSSSSSSSGSGTTSGTDSSSTETDDMSMDEETTEEEFEPLDYASETMPQKMPGIYGSPDAIQIDVLRIPRPDQFANQSALDQEMVTIPGGSGIKTVTYLIGVPETGAPPLGLDGEESMPGLMLRQIDREEALFAAEMGGLDNSMTSIEQVAPEVREISFQYFDGTGWTDSWDSSAMKGPPKAVMIRIAVVPKRQRETALSSWRTSQPAADENVLEYSSIVYLASSESAAAASSGSSTSEDSGTTDSGTSSGQDNSGSSNSGGSGSGNSGSGGASAGGSSGFPSGGPGGAGGRGGRGSSSGSAKGSSGGAGGNRDGSTGGNRGGNTGGNRGAGAGGSRGGEAGGSRGGNFGGNRGGNTGGGRGGSTGGNNGGSRSFGSGSRGS